MKLTKNNMPKHAPLAAIVVGGLLVVGLGWKLVVSPQSHKAASLDAQAAAVQQQIATNLSQVAAAKSAAAVTTPQIRVADVYKLAKAIPSSPDVPDLLIELSQVTKDAGVQLQSLSPTAPTPGQATVPITLNVDGDFYTITDLLYRLRNLVYVRDGALEASGRLFSVDNVSLSPQGSGRAISAVVQLHGYVYGAAPAATASVPTPTDTSTDTTATTTTPDSSSGAPSATGAP